MLCAEFEDRLTDYLDNVLESESQREFAAHALRCPVCHDLLNEVKNAIVECRSFTPPIPSPGLEARIILKTAPDSSMSCEQFEEHLTDYLDGFLPATLYHRWERHAAICEQCTELPGQVVRSIGACYSYISDEKPLSAGLHERILQATLGTIEVEQVRAPLPSRIAALLRDWLDAIVQPQLATVATMILMAVLVGTSTLSDDGSIGGMYRASLRLAAQTATQAGRVADELETLVAPPPKDASQSKPATSNGGGSNDKPAQK